MYTSNSAIFTNKWQFFAPLALLNFLGRFQTVNIAQETNFACDGPILFSKILLTFGIQYIKWASLS